MKIELSLEERNEIFPFHVLTKGDGEVCALGRSLKKLYPNIKVGDLITDHFELIQPLVSFLEYSIKQLIGKTVTIKHKNEVVLLKGQVCYLKNESLFLFIVSPFFTEISQIESIELTIDDFALYDPVIDYLMLLQDQKRSVKRAQALTCLLDEQKQFIERVAETGANIIYVYDIEEKKIIYVNGRAESILGYSIKEILSFDKTKLASLMHSKDIFTYDESIALLMEGKGDQHLENQFQIRHKLGHWVWLRDRIGVFSFAGAGKPKSIIGVSQDITELVIEQEEVEKERLKAISSSKMATLGEMAAGVAHEVNNPLAIIHGYANLLISNIQKEIPDREKIENLAQKIISTTERIARTIKGLRTFSRDAQKDPFELVTLNKIVNDTLELCQSRITNYNFEIMIEIPKKKIFIECRSVQLCQVLLNLIGNSFDAVRKSKSPWIKIAAEVTDQLIEISVTDCGLGIPKEDIDKVMQPFFTKKDVGEGTGLGLSISRGLVEAHAGTLHYDIGSKNTRFVITLPLRQQLGVLSDEDSAA